MSVRLVKGAYWDSEIKRAQERGLASFPVYTSQGGHRCQLPAVRCASCSPRARCIYPQFATHNAFTVAAVLALRPGGRSLRVPAPARHGRSAVRRRARGSCRRCRRCVSTPRSARTRTCCPTWCGACSRTAPTVPLSTSSLTPICQWSRSCVIPSLPWPADGRGVARPRSASRGALFAPERVNSDGEDFGDPAALAALEAEVRRMPAALRGGPILDGGDPRATHDVPVSIPGRYPRGRGLSPAMPRRRRSPRAMSWRRARSRPGMRCRLRARRLP